MKIKKRFFKKGRESKFGDYKHKDIVYEIPSETILEDTYSQLFQNLNDDEKSMLEVAIRKYKTRSDPLNEYLRNGEISEKYYKRSEILTKSLDKVSLNSNIVVSRYIGKGEEKAYLEEIAKHGYFIKKDFCSTFTRPEFGKSCIKKSHFKILIPKGSSGAYLDIKRHIFKSEKELLINKGSKFKQVEVEVGFRKKKIYTIELINEDENC